MPVSRSRVSDTTSTAHSQPTSPCCQTKNDKAPGSLIAAGGFAPLVPMLSAGDALAPVPDGLLLLDRGRLVRRAEALLEGKVGLLQQVRDPFQGDRGPLGGRFGPVHAP